MSNYNEFIEIKQHSFHLVEEGTFIQWENLKNGNTMTGTVRKIMPDAWYITGGGGFKFTLYHKAIESVGVRKPPFYPLIEKEVLSLNDKITHIYNLLKIKGELDNVTKKIKSKHGAFEATLERCARERELERKEKKINNKYGELKRTKSEKSIKRNYY